MLRKLILCFALLQVDLLHEANDATKHIANLRQRRAALHVKFNELSKGNRTETSVHSKAKELEIFPLMRKPKVRGLGAPIFSVPCTDVLIFCDSQSRALMLRLERTLLPSPTTPPLALALLGPSLLRRHHYHLVLAAPA